MKTSGFTAEQNVKILDGGGQDKANSHERLPQVNESDVTLRHFSETTLTLDKSAPSHSIPLTQGVRSKLLITVS